MRDYLRKLFAQILDYKIPLFAQTVGEFFSTKTNWISLIILGAATYAWSQSWISTQFYFNGIVGGLFGLTFRDALKKIYDQARSGKK